MWVVGSGVGVGGPLGTEHSVGLPRGVQGRQAGREEGREGGRHGLVPAPPGRLVGKGHAGSRAPAHTCRPLPRQMEVAITFNTTICRSSEQSGAGELRYQAERKNSSWGPLRPSLHPHVAVH